MPAASAKSDPGGVETAAEPSSRRADDPGGGERDPDQVERRREPAIATPSGPTNSNVTAMPSGIRSNDS